MTYTIEQIIELCEKTNQGVFFYQDAMIMIPELVAEVESLQKQLKEARAVIEFYADKDIWDPEIGFIQVSDCDLDGFHGCKAREWLEKWGDNAKKEKD